MFKTCFSKFPFLLVTIAFFTIGSVNSFTISDVNQLDDVGIDEKLGEKLSMDLVFTDENGGEVKIGDFFGDKRPVVINLGYYTCPTVCTLGVSGVVDVANAMDSLKIDSDYKVLTISISPDETSADAMETADKFRNNLKYEIDAGSWPFLTGSYENIKKLTGSLGYSYVKSGGEYAHPNALIVLTPQGEISRYLYGIKHNPTDFRLSLLEASDGKIGSSQTLNRVLMFCYQFDPVGKRYALQALNVVKAGGVVTLFLLTLFLSTLWIRERKNS